MRSRFVLAFFCVLLVSSALAQTRGPAPQPNRDGRKISELERIKAALQKQIAFAAFERNTPQLWSKVRRTLENSLTQEWQNGRLQGRTSSEAFFVKCDRSTMVQNDLDNGRLIVLVGIALEKPAEFTIFRLTQSTAEHH